MANNLTTKLIKKDIYVKQIELLHASIRKMYTLSSHNTNSSLAIIWLFFFSERQKATNL